MKFDTRAGALLREILMTKRAMVYAASTREGRIDSMAAIELRVARLADALSDSRKARDLTRAR